MNCSMQGKRKRGSVQGAPCGTPGCPNSGRWIPISEGNRLGALAPYRCRQCCDRINDKESRDE